MSVALSTLTGRLVAAVAAVDSVPSASQYELAVRGAVADYSRRRPNEKLGSLSIVSGTATYDLPDDFLRVIVLESLQTPDGILVSDAGLIPVSAMYEERWYVVGTEITFDPEPTYTTTRDLWYAAGHVLVSDVYPDMTEEDAALVMLKAQAIALGYQVNAMASDILSYAVGDVRVEKGQTVEALRKGAGDLETQYVAGIEAAIGVVGVRAAYSWAGR